MPAGGSVRAKPPQELLEEKRGWIWQVQGGRDVCAGTLPWVFPSLVSPSHQAGEKVKSSH